MSPRTGRPLSGSERRDVTVRLRMEPKEVEELDECANQLETTRSGVIREGLRLVKEKLANKKPDA